MVKRNGSYSPALDVFVKRAGSYARATSLVAKRAGSYLAVDNQLLRSWIKTATAVFLGSRPDVIVIVGDPCPIRDGSLIRMAYVDYDIVNQRLACCVSTSTDNGANWTPVSSIDTTPGKIISSRDGQWDGRHETPSIFKRSNGEYLYSFIGYVPVGDGSFFQSFPAHVGLATSTDGVTFTRYGTDPVLMAASGGSITSPSFFEFAGKLYMVYSDWTAGFVLSVRLAESTDGRTFTKVPTPIMTGADFPELGNAIAEVSVVQGPDGFYYMAFQTDPVSPAPQAIGIARAQNPVTGPWQINHVPIINGTAGQFDANGAIAPGLIFLNGQAQIYFHAFDPNGGFQIRIGVAKTAWPN